VDHNFHYLYLLHTALGWNLGQADDDDDDD
jgi:hypothetical protein